MWETSLIIGISYLCITVAGFNLLQSPDEVVWGAEGKRFSLECKVDEAWQWCYWEITKLDGVSQKYRTVSDGHLLEYPDHGITFSIDQNTCGIVFDALNPELHDGSWKCQVSDTDNDSHQIKVEANTTLHVAQKASIDFTYTIGQLSKWPFQHQLYDIVKLTCNTDMSIKPTPFVSIWMGLDGKEYRPLATSDESFPVQTEYEVTLEDDGAYFYCAVIQQKNATEILFEDQVETEKLNLVYPPILDTFDNPQYVYVNQTLIIPIGFLAKPMPQIEDITWQILALNDGFGHILQPGDEEANFNVKLPLVNGNRMLTSLVIQNITSDLNITLTIRNEIDELRHEMFVLYQPPVAYQGNDIITTGIPYWIFILIALGIILLVICFTFIYCATKKSRKQEQDARFKENLRNYVSRANGPTDRRVINLEDYPDQTLNPMLQTQDDSSSSESESDSNHPDDTLSGSVPSVDVQNSIEVSKSTLPNIQIEKSSEMAKSADFSRDSFQKSSTFKSSSSTMMYYESGMIRSTFKPQEPSLTLRERRLPNAPLRVDTPNTLPRPGGDVLRLGGITQFPVLSPPPPGYEEEAPIPGRKTSFINYMNPKEL